MDIYQGLTKSDLSLSDLMLVVERKKFLLQKFPQAIGQHISQSFWK